MPANASHPRFTILTPTYNRAVELQRLKESLDAQRRTDFEWLIVDDGSSDGTELAAGIWAGTAAYPVRYLRRANGGKHRALNDGIREARGDWVVMVDSDDRLHPGALAALAPAANRADRDPSLGGILGLKVMDGGARIGEPFPAGMERRSALDLALADRLRGDKAEVMKRDVLARFPFPEFEGETFLTENVVWFRIAGAGYEYLLLNAPIQICEYRGDGLSARSLELRLANPKGNLLYYAEALESHYPARALFRMAVNYARFAAHARWASDSALAAGSGSGSRGRHASGAGLSGMSALSGRARWLVALTSPFGVLAALRDRCSLALRARRARKDRP